MAITSNSKLREILADERAVAIIEEYKPGFMDMAEQMGPCMGMKIGMLVKFPQTGISAANQKELCARLDALDA